MKAQDLRIGNLANLTKDNFKTVKTYELDAYDIYKLSESDCADVQPIPLTEEWLLKFGCFEGFDWYCGDFYLPRIKEQGVKEFIVTPLSTKEKKYLVSILLPNHLEGSRLHLSTIYYVHQLQNLYHALIGEELTIKE